MQELMKFFTTIGFKVDVSGLKALDDTLKGIEKRLKDIGGSDAIKAIQSFNKAEQQEAKKTAKVISDAEKQKQSAIRDTANAQKKAAKEAEKAAKLAKKSAVENVYSAFSVAGRRNFAVNRGVPEAGYSVWSPGMSKAGKQMRAAAMRANPTAEYRRGLKMEGMARMFRQDVLRGSDVARSQKRILALQEKRRSLLANRIAGGSAASPEVKVSEAMLAKANREAARAKMQEERESRRLANVTARYAQQMSPLQFQIDKVKAHMRELSSAYQRGAISQLSYNQQLNIARQKLHNLNTMQGMGATGEGVGGGVLGFLAGTRFARSFAPERFPMGSLLGYGTGALGVGAALQNVTLVGEEIVGIQAGLEALSGSVQRGKENFDKIQMMADRLGMPVTDLGKNMVNLVAAVEGTPLADNIIGAAEGFYEFAIVTQRTPEQIQLAMRALGQMASKGKLSAEEVKNQFAEHIPGGLALFAEASGFGKGGDAVAQFLDKMADGDLYAKDVLPKVFDLMRSKAAPGLEKALGSSRFQRTRFQGELTNLIKVFNESGWQETLANFFRRLNEIAPQLVPVVKMLGEALSTFGRILGYVMDTLGEAWGILVRLDDATGGLLSELAKWLLMLNPITRGIALLVMFGDELELFFMKIRSMFRWMNGEQDTWFGKQIGDVTSGNNVMGGLKGAATPVAGIAAAALLGRYMLGNGAKAAAGAAAGGLGTAGSVAAGAAGGLASRLGALGPMVMNLLRTIGLTVLHAARGALTGWLLGSGQPILIRMVTSIGAAIVGAIAGTGFAGLAVTVAAVAGALWGLYEAIGWVANKIAGDSSQSMNSAGNISALGLSPGTPYSSEYITKEYTKRGVTTPQGIVNGMAGAAAGGVNPAPVITFSPQITVPVGGSVIDAMKADLNRNGAMYEKQIAAQYANGKN